MACRFSPDAKLLLPPLPSRIFSLDYCGSIGLLVNRKTFSVASYLTPVWTIDTASRSIEISCRALRWGSHILQPRDVKCSGNSHAFKGQQCVFGTTRLCDICSRNQRVLEEVQHGQGRCRWETDLIFLHGGRFFHECRNMKCHPAGSQYSGLRSKQKHTYHPGLLFAVC